MKNLLHFLQYHNAIPITLGIIFLGAGATFAATNPEAIYSSTQEVVAVDNTYIVDKDLSTYTPRVPKTSGIITSRTTSRPSISVSTACGKTS